VRRGIAAASAALVAMSLLGLGSSATAASSHRAEATAAGRTLTFAGYEWQVRRTGVPGGPGPNCFSDAPQQVFVDKHGRLHLRIDRVSRRWCSSEVINVDPSVGGYGTYRWTIGSRLDRVDPRAVLGLFTWDSSAREEFHREIDIEVTRWSRPLERTNAQFVVQPHARDGNLKRIRLPEKRAGLRLSLTWTPDSLTFRAPDVGVRWVYRGPDIPVPGQERVHMNLWQHLGQVPSDGKPVEVVISDFTFTPRT
jgi:hypothetical protein